MSFQFKLTVRGEQRFFEGIERVSRAASDVRELEGGWQPHEDIYVDYERRYLDSEGAGGWVPNTAEYQARKVLAVGNKPQMQFSGNLYRSLTDEGSSEFVRIEGPNFLQTGSANPLALIHHEGRGREPVRELIVVSDEQAQAHRQQFVDSYAATAQAAGFRVI